MHTTPLWTTKDGRARRQLVANTQCFKSNGKECQEAIISRYIHFLRMWSMAKRMEVKDYRSPEM